MQSYEKKTMWKTCLNFLFPASCLGCGNLLSPHEEFLCTQCNFERNFTYWKVNSPNAMFSLLEHYIPVQSAVSLFYFTKENVSQKLLHHLKYKGLQKLGMYLANELYIQAEMHKLKDVDAVVPVPIHSKKLKNRGYNQNDFFAKELSNLLNVDYVPFLLTRIKHQKSQTLMNKNQRLQRLSATFEIQENSKKYNHILLIDDVCTTGATLIACGFELQKICPKISVATMAFAK